MKSIISASLVLFALVSAQLQNNATSEIVPLLQQGHLIPTVLPSFNATIGPFIITYPEGIVNYGSVLSVQSVRSAPLVQFAAESSFTDAKYTLAMIDPDAPSPQNPTSANIRHWLVADVSPSTSASNLTSGNVLSSYRSPAPPATSTAHRYTFILLRQPGNSTISVFNQTSTSNFNFTQFVQANELIIVSANYFNATASNSTTTTSSTMPTSSSRTTTGTVTTATSASSSQLISLRELLYMTSGALFTVVLFMV